eukprot:GGOE01065295.1.p1 GENE.GGOE01065295.1~~GGOE01065295.1.p1  ORF type:complete len:288 (+),score=81.93 GGOE01065295.1:35-865(+)
MASPLGADIPQLEAELQQCVARLEFERAAQLRDQLQALKKKQVAELEAQLQKHVSALEFEKAAKLRDHIHALQATGPEDRKQKRSKRTVYLSRLPPAMTQKQLRQHFKTALHIEVHKGKVYGYAFVTFKTPQEAAKVVAKKEVTVGGCVIMACKFDDKEATRQSISERNSRTVFLRPVPLSVNNTHLEQCFPNAEHIHHRTGKDHGFAFVCFPTVEEAQAVAARCEVDAAGHRIPVAPFSSEPQAARKRPASQARKRPASQARKSAKKLKTKKLTG